MKPIVIIASLLIAQVAAAETPATFVLAIGTNQVPPTWQDTLQPLEFADDDALAFAALAEDLDWTWHLLTIADESSQRRYAPIIPRAVAPSMRSLRDALATLRTQIETARAAGRTTELIVSFSGHGRSNPPQLALIDGSISQDMLYEEILAALPAQRVHLIIDACHAESLVGERGEQDREAQIVSVDQEDRQQWLQRFSLDRFPHVGVVAASSAGALAHEWDALERGVFTHQVISGLRGAADVNGDRLIEYSELHAFVAAANRDVQVAKARIDLVARVPKLNLRGVIADLNSAQDVAWLEFPDPEFGRFHIEDRHGTRLADAHGEAGHRLAILVSPQSGLSVVSGKGQVLIDLKPGERRSVSVASLRASPERTRGAVAASFARDLFKTAYGPSYYRGFVDKVGGVAVQTASPAPPDNPNNLPAWLSWGGAAASVIAAGAFGGLALDARSEWNNNDLQLPAQQARQRYDRMRTGFFVSIGASAVLGALGAVLYTGAADE